MPMEAGSCDYRRPLRCGSSDSGQRSWSHPEIAGSSIMRKKWGLRKRSDSDQCSPWLEKDGWELWFWHQPPGHGCSISCTMALFCLSGCGQTANGAAMSLGRVSTFSDIYLERDIDEGVLRRKGHRSDRWFCDQTVLQDTWEPRSMMSCSPVTPTDYNLSVDSDGRTLVKGDLFRFLHTLENLGPAPDICRSLHYLPLPQGNCAPFIETCFLQHENDLFRWWLWYCLLHFSNAAANRCSSCRAQSA